MTARVNNNTWNAYQSFASHPYKYDTTNPDSQQIKNPMFELDYTRLNIMGITMPEFSNISISIENFPVIGKRYTETNLVSCSYLDTSGFYFSRNTHPGFIEITNLDTEKKQITGYFSFDLIGTDSTKTISITNGYFNVSYSLLLPALRP